MSSSIIRVLGICSRVFRFFIHGGGLRMYMFYLIQCIVGRVAAVEVNLSSRDPVISCLPRLGVKG